MGELPAAEVYRQLVRAIDEAVRAENIHAVPAVAEAAGMSGGQTHKGLSERWQYTYRDPVGQTVDLHCRCYDRSSSFSIQPDMHKMSVELRGPELITSHSGYYEA